VARRSWAGQGVRGGLRLGRWQCPVLGSYADRPRTLKSTASSRWCVHPRPVQAGARELEILLDMPGFSPAAASGCVNSWRLQCDYFVGGKELMAPSTLDSTAAPYRLHDNSRHRHLYSTANSRRVIVERACYLTPIAQSHHLRTPRAASIRRLPDGTPAHRPRWSPGAVST